jgi:hypothetical protein
MRIGCGVKVRPACPREGTTHEPNAQQDLDDDSFQHVEILGMEYIVRAGGDKVPVLSRQLMSWVSRKFFNGRGIGRVDVVRALSAGRFRERAQTAARCRHVVEAEGCCPQRMQRRATH